jgi:hypothetical protein
LAELKARDEDLAKQFDGQTVSNLVTGAIRWDSVADRWKQWNGTSWAELTTIYALTGLSTTGAASIGGALTVTGAAALNGGGTSTTVATADNSTAIATTAFVKAQAYATLASPALTGTPTAPTAALGTNTTQIATTAFVNSEIANDAPSKTGTGASGTWGISITGNAATATTLATARAINGVSFNGSADINVPDLRASNGTVLIDGTGVTSAVNYIGLVNAIAGGTPAISTAGADTNIPLIISTKGAGGITLQSVGGNIALRPSAGSILFYDAVHTYYTNLDNGSLTANRTLTMPNGNVTLVAGTMVPTAGTGATGTWGISITGNAATASTWATARTLSYTGDVTGSGSVSGGGNVAFAMTLAAGVVGTTELTDAGVTAAKLSGAQSGSAPIYGARAWVNFNTVTTTTIRADGNVTSLTDTGTGDTTVNFTTAMADANYAAIGTCTNPYFLTLASVTTTSVRVATNEATIGPRDTSIVCVSVFR